jgi:hypothetical protein
MTALMEVIGDPQKVLAKAEELYKAGQAQLGLEVLDVLIQAEPENIQARQMRVKLLQKIRRGDRNLMSRNAYTTFISRDKKFLVKKGVIKTGRKEAPKPYVYEHEKEPAFSVLIPGEFVKQDPGTNLFAARAANSTLSISLSKLEENPDLGQAAQEYVEALKKLGDGKAELEQVTRTKLPDGSPAVEFVVKWATKNDLPLTTQALAVYKGGYSIAMGTHTWAGKLPDKKILYTIKFK